MKKNVFIYVALGLLASCTSEKPAPIGLDASPVVAQRMVTPLGDTLVVANMDLMIDTIDFPMSLLFSDLEIIKLEERDEALIDMIYLADVSPNYMALYSYYNGIKLFDREGYYISDISRRGQGPEEYASALSHLVIDEPNNRLFFSILGGDRIMSFDLKGNPCKPILLASGKLSKIIKFRIDNNRQKVIIAQGGLHNVEEPTYWTQDMDGNYIQQLPVGHLAATSGGLNNGLGELFNTSAMDYAIGYWWQEDRVDSLYHYDERANRLKPVFTANLTSIPLFHLYIDLPRYYLIQMGDYGGVLTNYRHILIDKETLKGSYVRFNLDMLGNIGLQDWMYFVRGNYFKEFHPYELIEQWQGSDEFSELPPNMAKFMRYLQTHDTEDMNNVVLIGKLKQSHDEEFVLHDMNFKD